MKKSRIRNEEPDKQTLDRYFALRNVTLWGAAIVLCITCLFSQSGEIKYLIPLILLSPISVIAFLAAKKYWNFSPKVKKGMKVNFFSRSPISFHPYAALIYVLAIQGLFVFLYFNG